MIETILSRAVRRLFAGGAAAGIALLALPAQAQVEQVPPMQRVEITGSSIKRLAAQTSLPITTMRADDFAKQGLTTVQEVLNTIPMNQTSTGASQSVGAGTGGRAVAACAAWAATRPWCCSTAGGWRIAPTSPTPST